MNQPLIILGMHRSGTSMLTRILRQQGVFLGHKIQGDDEALFFLHINRWMLHMAGTDWDRPQPALEMLQDNVHVERLAEYVKTRLSGIGTFDYLGTKCVTSKMRIGPELPFLWGFKDPRTSITLPVWLKLFPDAKLLRIKRHGIDVAASLRSRYLIIRDLLGNYRTMSRLGLSWPERNRTIDAFGCATLEGGLKIWDAYESALDDYMSLVPEDRQMTIRYEDYVANFETMHQQVADFTGIQQLTALPQDIIPDARRVYAYRNKPDCLKVASAEAKLLAKHGY